MQVQRKQYKSASVLETARDQKQVFCSQTERYEMNDEQLELNSVLIELIYVKFACGLDVRFMSKRQLPCWWSCPRAQHVKIPFWRLTVPRASRICKASSFIVCVVWWKGGGEEMLQLSRGVLRRLLRWGGGGTPSLECETAKNYNISYLFYMETRSMRYYQIESFLLLWRSSKLYPVEMQSERVWI